MTQDETTGLFVRRFSGLEAAVAQRDTFGPLSPLTEGLASSVDFELQRGGAAVREFWPALVEPTGPQAPEKARLHALQVGLDGVA